MQSMDTSTTAVPDWSRSQVLWLQQSDLQQRRMLHIYMGNCESCSPSGALMLTLSQSGAHAHVTWGTISSNCLDMIVAWDLHVHVDRTCDCRVHVR